MFLGGTHELRAPSPIRDEKVQNVPSQADCNTCKIGALTIYAPTFAQSPQTICGLRKQVVRYRAHQTIQRAGEVPSRAYTLFKGWACRAIHFPDGRRQILSVLLPGDTICIETSGSTITKCRSPCAR